MSSQTLLPSSSSSSPSSPSNFQHIFNTALRTYEKQTKKNLLAHPLAARLQACDSPSAVLAVLQGQVQEFDQTRSSDEGLMKWLGPTVNVLYALSATLGEGVGLIFSPAKVIFAGVGVLLLAAKDVGASQDALFNLFERIQNFIKRLETYSEVPPTEAMMEIIVKIMVEVLCILALTTKELKRGRTKKYLKKLVGSTDAEDALKRLDVLTNEEARMATAQILKVTHDVDSRVKDVSDKIKVVIDDGKEVKGIIQQEAKGAKEYAQEMAREAKAIMQKAANDVNDIKRNQLRQDLRKWLCPPDPSTNHNIACSAHHKGTAEWFFKGSIFEEWKSTGSLLWIHGKPGSGKSILCSAIIQDTIASQESGSASMAYFYFDFRDVDKQHRRSLLPSLLIQLSACSIPRCDILFHLYMAHDDGARKPSDGALTECLKEMLSLPDQTSTYVIVDALDECPNNSGIPTPREQVLQLVKDLVALRLPNFHICVTSRPEIDIRAALEPLAIHTVSLHDQNGQNKDIVDYVRSVVYSDSETMMRRWRDEDKDLVIKILSEKADGMFRWVFCQLEVLRHCLPPSVRRTLNELPQSLDETYERMLNEINKANRDHAYRLLQCLSVAIRPLLVEELAEVLAVDFDEPGGIPKLNSDWRWDDQEQAVVSACSNLVAIVPVQGSYVVQFSHFSVKEFLTSDRLANSCGDISRYHIDLEPAHTTLAQACLGVLLHLDEHVENSAKRFPLAQYAAKHWLHHAKFENVSAHIKEGMEHLFDSDKPHLGAWIQLFDIDDQDVRYNYETYRLPREATPLYYAILCGFLDLAEYYVTKRPRHVNARGGYHETTFHAAVSKQDLRMMQLLIDHGGNVNVRGAWNRTPLHLASLRGYLDIAHWLLDHGAEVNAKQDNQWTPLHMGVYHGRLEVVRLFLERKADVEARDSQGRVPLHLISEHYSITGQLQIVQLLLDNGADPNTQNGKGSTPLHIVFSNGKLEVARLLLAHGAKVDVKDNVGKTPYEAGLESGHQGIMQLLSKHGGT